MSGIRHSIDLNESTGAGKIMRIIFGIASLAATVWYAINISGTAASTLSSWLAVGFIFLFGVWLIGSGAGLTKRYIIIGDDKIILRQEFYRLPLNFTTLTLKAVEFRPLTIYFHSDAGKITLRLGARYPEQSALIMEEVQEFCLRHEIKIKGDHVSDIDE